MASVRCGLVKTLTIIAGAVATGAIAVVGFPGSWPAVAIGWTLYLTMAIVSTTWYTGLLILAVLSIWWVLRQPALSPAAGRRPSPLPATPHARSMSVATQTRSREK